MIKTLSNPSFKVLCMSELIMQLGKTELEELYNTGKGLQPIIKKTQTVDDWLNVYQDKKQSILKFAQMFEEWISDLKEEVNRTKATQMIVDNLRRSQEYWFKKGNFNKVKFGCIIQMANIWNELPQEPNEYVSLVTKNNK